jgi:RNA polymerase sigma-70 factor (ECF subfamily)
MNQNFQDDELENIPAGNNQQPEQQAEFQQQTETLLQLISELPDEQREAFLLREEAGMSLAEIAEVTGVNIETAKSRLRYAVNRLRKGMNDNE